MKHGRSAYRSGFCKCPVCTEDHRVHHQLEAQRRKIKTEANGGVAPVAVHDISTYTNWYCRCPTCKAAWSVEMARRKKAARKKGLHGR